MIRLTIMSFFWKGWCRAFHKENTQFNLGKVSTFKSDTSRTISISDKAAKEYIFSSS